MVGRVPLRRHLSTFQRICNETATFARTLHEQVHVVVFAVLLRSVACACEQASGEDAAQDVDNVRVVHAAAISCEENPVHMQLENAVFVMLEVASMLMNQPYHRCRETLPGLPHIW